MSPNLAEKAATLRLYKYLKAKLEFTRERIKVYYNKYHSLGLVLKKGVYCDDEDKVKGLALGERNYIYLFS